MTNAVAFIKTPNGLTLMLGDKQHTIGQSHPNYEKILAVLKNGQYEQLEQLVDIPASITAAMGGTGVTVENGQVLYKGQPAHNVVSNKILEFMREGLPHQPLVNFLDNLMQNPSARSVDELYKFLEHQGLPITEDGCFLAYKGVDHDYLDKYSRTLDNSVGKTVEFPRNKVDDNCNNTCSYGLHVGTLDYASHYAGFDVLVDAHVMIVKVNPKDAVSVPTDESARKLRVSRYEVVGETMDRKLLSDPLYQNDGSNYEEESDGPSDEELDYMVFYSEGEESFHGNLDRDQNPYPVGTIENDEWEKGWQDAADTYAERGEKI